MFFSTLGDKIALCQSVERLNEQECLDVIRMIQEELRCSTMNQLLTKMIVNMEDMFTSKNISRIKNAIQKMVENRSNHNQASPGQAGKTQSPIIRLPVDVLTKTSTFLNEKDVFQFERCCREFYQIINNVGYLTNW